MSSLFELKQHLTELEQINKEMQDTMNALKRTIRQQENEQKQIDAVQELNDYYNFLCENTVHIGARSIAMSHALAGYGICHYCYKLPVVGFDKSAYQLTEFGDGIKAPHIDISNVCIQDVSLPQPNNKVEAFLYPYISAVVRPLLPIAFETYTPDDANYYCIRPKNGGPVSFRISQGAYIFVYYLEKDIPLYIAMSSNTPRLGIGSNAYGQFWYGKSTNFPGFLYKKNTGSGARRTTKFAPGGNITCNAPTYIYNKFKPGTGGVGGTSLAVRRAKMRLATVCEGPNGQCGRFYPFLGLYDNYTGNPNGVPFRRVNGGV